MAGTNFNPSWGDSIKWNSPAGSGGFGGGVSPGSSFEPPSGFPSAGDSGFWKNQPTDPDYYNKGKTFLDAFKNFKLNSNQDKYQQQAQQGGFQTGEQDGSLGGFSTKIGSDATLVYPPSPFKPFSVVGTPGKQGVGGAIGQIAGTALGFALGGPAGAGLGGSLGGAAGSFFG
jgi:hypothetical protein